VTSRRATARRVLREEVIDVDEAALLARRVAIMELWTDAAELILNQVSASLEHLHDDVRAIREALHIPRPECYPPADDVHDVDAGVERP
jgi:hypothetical protein